MHESIKRPGQSLIYKQNFEKTKRQNRENNFIYSVKKTYIATAYHPLYTHTLSYNQFTHADEKSHNALTQRILRKNKLTP